MITVKRYGADHESTLFALIKNEGEEWKSYWGGESSDKYKAALKSSIVYVAYERDILCGYCR